jgi:hypothetical protein
MTRKPDCKLGLGLTTSYTKHTGITRDTNFTNWHEFEGTHFVSHLISSFVRRFAWGALLEQEVKPTDNILFPPFANDFTTCW